MNREEQGLQVADSMPATLGPKTGCTAKEMRRKVDEYLKRKGMRSYPFGRPRRAKPMKPKSK